MTTGSLERRAARMALLCIGALCWFACASTHQDNPVGGETNWLSPCTDAEDCNDGLQCLCGQCTRDCESTAACPAEAPRCVTPGDGAACTGTAPATGACLAPCERDGDCASLGAMLRCAGGRCEAPAQAGAPALCTDRKVTTCEADDACRLVMGDPLDDAQCLGAPVALGCVSVRAGCFDGGYQVLVGPDQVNYRVTCLVAGYNVIFVNPEKPLAAWTYCGDAGEPQGCAGLDCIADYHCCDTCAQPACLPEAMPCPTDCNWDPCAGAQCGAACRECAPWDPDCAETDDEKGCDGAGTCMSIGNFTCADAGDGSFPCGDVLTCAASEYCQEFIAGVPGGMNSYSCVSLGGASCAEVGRCSRTAAASSPWWRPEGPPDRPASRLAREAKLR